jgi:membrane associated rhomboid family serine protease
MIALGLTAITVIVSFLAFQNQDLMRKLLFYPYLMNNNKSEWYRFISSAFVHADWMHLLFNMWALYSFGTHVEWLFGSPLFLIFYLSAAAVSCIADFQKHKDNQYFSSLGASGAVSAIIMAGIINNPWQGSIIVLVVPMPPIIFGALYLGYTYYKIQKGSSDNIAHNAHFHGAIYGILFTLLMLPGSFQRFLTLIMQPEFNLGF